MLSFFSSLFLFCFFFDLLKMTVLLLFYLFRPFPLINILKQMKYIYPMMLFNFIITTSKIYIQLNEHIL